MIPAAAIEAAHEQLDAMGSYVPRKYIEAALEAAAPHLFGDVAKLVGELIDHDDCWFDHHGGCQAHGYLLIGPGESCPQQEAKDWLSTHLPPHN